MTATAEAGVATSTEETARSHKSHFQWISGHFQWVSWLYVLRFFWRFLDVSSLIFIRTLCWLIIGGTALTAVIAVEGIAIFVICVRKSQWELLYGIVSIIITLDTEEKELISKMTFLYRCISNLVLMILITVWLTVDFECARCTDYNLRNEYRSETSILTLLVISWFGTIFVPGITVLLHLRWKVFQEKASKSRDVADMIATSHFDGILEMQLYNSQHVVYDEVNKSTLLMLAFQEQRAPIISHLFRNLNENEWSAKDAEGRGILDYFLSGSSTNNVVGSSAMIRCLVKVQRESDVVDRDEHDAFLCGCKKGIDGIVDDFKSAVPNILDAVSDPKVILSYAVDQGMCFLQNIVTTY